MRILILMAGTLLIAGCSIFAPSRSSQGCQNASHELRVHDMKIDAARASGAMGFNAILASRSYNNYRCTKMLGNQVACVPVESAAALPGNGQVERLLRERRRIEARVARACQV